MLKFARRFACGINQFRASNSGGIAIVFALSLLPIIMSIGIAIDYSKASDSKTKLDAAADSAALAAVTAAVNIVKNAPDGADTATLNASAIAQGRTAAQTIFSSSAANVSNTRNVSATVDLVREGLKFNSTITYKADVITSFGSLANINAFSLQNTIGAQSQLDPYLDIYIVIDNSGSMGVGATDADVALMNATNGLNCAFGCHIAGIRLNGAGLTNYEEAHNIGATLKIDVVRHAIISLLAKAKVIKKSNDQFRFTILTFASTLKTLQPASVDYDALNIAIGNLTSDTVNGGTNFHYSIGTQLPGALPTVSGSGKTASDRITQVILVTDGVEDGIFFPNAGIDSWVADPYLPFWYGNGAPLNIGNGAPVQAVDPTICDNVKSLGAQVSILNTDYPIISGDSRSVEINSNITNHFQTTIALCASSPGQFYSVNSSTQIGQAVNTIFGNILNYTRLTN